MLRTARHPEADKAEVNSSPAAAMPTPVECLRKNWPLYIYEGILLAGFMISASLFTALMEYPRSPATHWIQSQFWRRGVIGLAMGATAVLLIYSPIGKRSGAHMNPAFTIGFLRLAKIRLPDAVGYIAGQFIGGAAGVYAAILMLGHQVMASSAVNYVVTVPGIWGTNIAWLGEFTIAFLMMATVLAVNQIPRLAPWTGCFAGMLIVLFVLFEAPLSGFSMNPARTFGSAVPAGRPAGYTLPHRFSACWPVLKFTGYLPGNG